MNFYHSAGVAFSGMGNYLENNLSMKPFSEPDRHGIVAAHSNALARQQYGSPRTGLAVLQRRQGRRRNKPSIKSPTSLSHSKKP